MIIGSQKPGARSQKWVRLVLFCLLAPGFWLPAFAQTPTYTLDQVLAKMEENGKNFRSMRIGPDEFRNNAFQRYWLAVVVGGARSVVREHGTRNGQQCDCSDKNKRKGSILHDQLLMQFC